MEKKNFKISIEAAVGYQSYDCMRDVEWVDLQSTTYLKLYLIDGSILYLNDFNVRSILVQPE